MKITPKQQSRLEEFEKKFVMLYGIHMNPDIGAREVKDFLLKSMQIAVTEEREKREEVEKDFDDWLRMSNHYATLLNDYDGGKRITFKSYKQWKERQRVINSLTTEE